MNQRLGPKLAAIVALFCVVSFSALAANERYLRIASGDVASGLFSLAGVVANSISAPRDGLVAVAQVSSSGQAALTKLRSGGVDVALVPDSVAYAALNGDAARRDRPWPALRSLASFSAKSLIIVVRGDYEVVSLATLQGWRIAVGPRASDVNNTITSLLAAMGLTGEFYRAVNADANASPYELITKGQADAVVVLASALPADVRSGIASGMIKLYSPGKSELERGVSSYPFMNRQVIDLGTGTNYATLTSSSVLVTRADLPAQLVTTVLERLWLKPVQGLDVNNAALNLPAPLHSSALKFYQDRKLLESDRATR